MKTFNRGVVSAAALLIASVAMAQQTAAQEFKLPETLFVDGHIYIGGPATTEGTHAEFVSAMLVRGDRIVATGDSKQLLAVATPGVKTIDLQGKTVLPGLIDTHTHSMDWALTVVRGQIDLRYPNVKSIAEVQAKIRERVKTLKPGEWIQGTAWDDSKFTEDRYITRQDIDAVAPNNPVYLEHVTGHLGVANSVALKLAGIDASTQDPSGGLIQHDAAGQPTGIVKDNAMGLVESKLPVPTHEDWVAAAAYVSKACMQVGLTSIHDVAMLAPAMDAYQDAYQRGLLHVRVEMAPLGDERGGRECAALQRRAHRLWE